MLRIIFLLTVLIPSSAFALSFDGKFVQGHFIIGKTQPKTEIWVDKKRVKVTDDGYFVFGIGRDRKYDVSIDKVPSETIRSNKERSPQLKNYMYIK